MPGANDGASGVAVLLGVSDVLQESDLRRGVDLLFVDGEDWGDFGDRVDVLLGSRRFASTLREGYAPEFGVLFDLVGARGGSLSPGGVLNDAGAGSYSARLAGCGKSWL